MKIQIPRPGDEILLLKDWTFLLEDYWNNQKVYQIVTGKEEEEDIDKVPVTLPYGTKLSFNKIDIKKGRKGLVTFKITEHQDSRYLKKYLDVRLKDVNRIEGELFIKEVIPNIIIDCLGISIGDFGCCCPPSETGKIVIDNEEETEIFELKIKHHKKGKIVTSIDYILKDLNKVVLFQTSDLKELKEKAKEIFTEMYKASPETYD